jgi:hypothetical protein
MTVSPSTAIQASKKAAKTVALASLFAMLALVVKAVLFELLGGCS